MKSKFAAVLIHYAGFAFVGMFIPEAAVYLDWTLMATWFAALAFVDFLAVILLLATKNAKFLMSVMYASAAWSILLAGEAAIMEDTLIQFDRYAQWAIFVGIVAALAWGAVTCRESKPRSSSLRS